MKNFHPTQTLDRRAWLGIHCNINFHWRNNVNQKPFKVDTCGQGLIWDMDDKITEGYPNDTEVVISIWLVKLIVV